MIMEFNDATGIFHPFPLKSEWLQLTSSLAPNVFDKCRLTCFIPSIGEFSDET